MKIKNLILGLLAFVFAIGSSFASLIFAPDPAYVKVQMTGPSDPFTCQPTGLSCNASAGPICRVAILVQGVSTTVDARKITTCIKPLFDSRPFIGQSTLNVYSVEP